MNQKTDIHRTRLTSALKNKVDTFSFKQICFNIIRKMTIYNNNLMIYISILDITYLSLYIYIYCKYTTRQYTELFMDILAWDLIWFPILCFPLHSISHTADLLEIAVSPTSIRVIPEIQQNALLCMCTKFCEVFQITGHGRNLLVRKWIKYNQLIWGHWKIHTAPELSARTYYCSLLLAAMFVCLFIQIKLEEYISICQG